MYTCNIHMCLLHTQHFAYFRCAHTPPVARICRPSSTVRAGVTEPATPGLHSQPYSLLPLLSTLTYVLPSAHLLSGMIRTVGRDPSLAPNCCFNPVGDFSCPWGSGMLEASFRGSSVISQSQGNPQRPSWGTPPFLQPGGRDRGEGREAVGLSPCPSFHQSAATAQQLLISFLFFLMDKPERGGTQGARAFDRVPEHSPSLCSRGPHHRTKTGTHPEMLDTQKNTALCNSHQVPENRPVQSNNTNSSVIPTWEITDMGKSNRIGILGVGPKQSLGKNANLLQTDQRFLYHREQPASAGEGQHLIGGKIHTENNYILI